MSAVGVSAVPSSYWRNSQLAFYVTILVHQVVGLSMGLTPLGLLSSLLLGPYALLGPLNPISNLSW